MKNIIPKKFKNDSDVKKYLNDYFEGKSYIVIESAKDEIEAMTKNNLVTHKITIGKKTACEQYNSSGHFSLIYIAA